MTTGEKILSMRKARGWSQEELAEQLGVSRQAVSRWESGSAMPDADKLIAVCQCFGVSADYLLGTGFSGDASPGAVSCPMPGESGRLRGNQILGFLFLAFGLLCRFGLELIGVFRPHEFHTDTGIYRGLQAYVRVYDLQWILWIVWILVAVGILLLLWGPIKNLVGKGCKKWIRMLF